MLFLKLGSIYIVAQLTVQKYSLHIPNVQYFVIGLKEAYELKWYARIILEFIFLFQQTGNVIPPQVKAGDEVLLPEYGGTKVELEDKQEFHLFRESDILAKVE